MQDLTTGSLARHLMKTMSFMLVTMLLWIWYLSVAGVTLQMAASLVLLRRELRRRLEPSLVARHS